MRVIFFGTPQFAIPTLENLLDRSDFEVIAVVTQPDKPRGRGNQVTPSPIKEVALKHQIPVLQPKRIKKETETLNYLRQAAADAFVVVAYGQILSAEILAMPKLGCINVHGSILPKYRGAAPIQWSICNGEAETGITTMLMDEGMDTGAMLLKANTPIGLFDNAYQIGEILARLGAEILVETLLKLEKKDIQGISQDNSEATYAPLIKKEDFIIDWSHPAIAIHNRVRGFYPNCVTSFRGQPLKVMATVPLGDKYRSLPPDLKNLEQQTASFSSVSASPGEIVKIVKNFGAIVQTGDGFLLLREVQPAGKRIQSGWDFVNGMRTSIGEVLGTI